MRYIYKNFLSLWLAFAAILLLPACSTNPATGASQLSFISPAQEARMGAAEHEKVMKIYGEIEDAEIRAYVRRVGQAVAANTERKDVTYKFHVLDTPMVNAFALPGGYVYITRGILALANNEAELAAVIAHEIGHITARHSAARYSQGILASVGAIAVAMATDSSTAARAAQLGSDLYIKSYSRGQEHESDDLGIRYLHRAGYDTFAMAGFLDTMGRQADLEDRINGKGTSPSLGYFSTHPRTEDRVAQASSIAASYSKGQARTNRDGYLDALNGMVYGDSAKQGFARGQDFYHPEMGFTFSVPPGFSFDNRPSQIVVTGKGGEIVLFDAAENEGRLSPGAYLVNQWMGDKTLRNVENITINGLSAATGEFDGTVGGKSVTIRLVAVSWSPDRFFRFQMAIPKGAGAAQLDGLKRMTYSLRRLSAEEKNSIRPLQLRAITARAGDTAAGLARSMPFDSHHEERFRILNAIPQGRNVVAGNRYKIVE